MSSKNSNINLSKSLYCSGVLCPKMVWLQRNKPEEAVSSTNESVLENGNKVGKVARPIIFVYNNRNNISVIIHSSNTIRTNP